MTAIARDLLARAIADHTDGRLGVALTGYRRVLILAPASPIAQHNLGILVRKAAPKHDPAATIETGRVLSRATILAPSEPGPRFALGNVLFALGRLPECRAAFRRAIVLEPAHARALGNLGQVEIEAGQLDHAEAILRRALASDPGSGIARSFLGEVMLSRGDMTRGWPLYVTRSRMPVVAPQDPVKVLKSDGGLGDVLMHARFLTESVVSDAFAKRRPRLLVPAPLVDLLSMGLPHLDVVSDGSGTADEPTVSWLIRERRLGPDDADFPAAWLRTAIPPTAAPKTHPARVGLCWKSGNGGYRKRKRDLPADALSSLATLNGATFVSLQTGSGSTPPIPSMIDDTDRFMGADGFVRMAREVANLDLVITVDTYVAHLAGALGVPTWVLLPVGPCWRWGTPEHPSLWYPAIRQFRQTRDDRWDDVIRAVRKTLETGIR